MPVHTAGLVDQEEADASVTHKCVNFLSGSV